MNIKILKENTYSILVPRGIRYLSEWQDFGLLPFPHILDKQIPGCGFTEYCLTNYQDLVLCSPRKLLLENKYDQHKEDIYYLINSNEDLNYDKNINKNDKHLYFINKSKKTEEEIEREKLEYYLNKKEELEKYIKYRRSQRKPFKIIVTYDSFYLIKKILTELSITKSDMTMNRIQFIVDEMQSIFIDASFKSSTENDFIVSLKGIQNLCFVSATPMIEEYLRQVDIFKDLPYYELDWITEDPVRVKKPELEVKVIKSATTVAMEIINTYLNGDFKFKYKKDKDNTVKKVYSKEAVLYLNSVNNILSVIKKLDLKPEQVNILCARTEENQSRVKKKLGSKFLIGRVPLKGEPHKMFTFCTRTVYLGADFYSTNARSFIISDANIETLAVDISLDLPQILGRQRLIENPWKDEATFYYKSICSGKVVTKEHLDKQINKKLKSTEKLLNAYGEVSEENQLELINMYERDAISTNYKVSYVAVNKIFIKPGVFIKKPTMNDLVRIAEQRAFDIQQVDYANRFNVFSSMSSTEISLNSSDEVVKFFEKFEKLSNLYQKLRYYCEYPCSDEVRRIILNQISEKRFREYIESLTIEELKACGYNTTKINKYLGIISFDIENLSKAIYNRFKVGDKYSKSKIKQDLIYLYDSVGYKARPKASDLKQWFELKTIKLKNESGKWVDGFELMGKK